MEKTYVDNDEVSPSSTRCDCSSLPSIAATSSPPDSSLVSYNFSSSNNTASAEPAVSSSNIQPMKLTAYLKHIRAGKKKPSSCKIYLRDMKKPVVDLSEEICGITQSSIIEILANRPDHEFMFLLFACDTSFSSKNDGQHYHHVRRFMTADTLHGWFEQRQATQGGLGFFDYANRQPIKTVHTYLLDPEMIEVNNPQKYLSPLCSVHLMSVVVAESSTEDSINKIRKMLRYHHTVLKILSNSFHRGLKTGERDALMQSLLAAALLIKQHGEKEVSCIISGNIITELCNFCGSNYICEQLFALESKFMGHPYIEKLARKKRLEMSQ